VTKLLIALATMIALVGPMHAGSRTKEGWANIQGTWCVHPFGNTQYRGATSDDDGTCDSYKTDPRTKDWTTTRMAIRGIGELGISGPKQFPYFSSDGYSSPRHRLRRHLNPNLPGQSLQRRPRLLSLIEIQLPVSGTTRAIHWLLAAG
jgi:hypothetical protein